jgi:ABC-type lipoprotein export system ATPase subunit
MTLMELDNVSKAFNEKILFENISLKVKESTINTMMGSSGSGKTTLLMMAGALLPSQSGNIYIMGNKINSLKEKILKQYRKSYIGFIFQHFNLFDTLNAYENISIGSDIFHNKDILTTMDNLNILHLKIQKLNIYQEEKSKG